MPDQNEYLIGQPEFSELLMRALFLKGDLPQYVGAPYAATLQLADFSVPEYMPLRRWRRFCMRATIAASVGNFTGVYFGIRDQASHRSMALVEGLWIRPVVAASSVRWGVDGDNLLLPAIPAAGGLGQDDRSAGDSNAISSAFSLGTFTNAANPLSANAPEILRANTDTVFTTVDPSRPIILTNKPINTTPRSYLYVVPQPVNVGADATVFWRERPLLETEL